MSLPFLYQQPRWYHYLVLCSLALFFRLGIFFSGIQEQKRYMQPDSNDYHISALCMKHGLGMHYPDGRPIFWRTPGYPLFLAPFYSKTVASADPAHHTESIHSALIVQIIICSLLPFLLFQLAFTLTSNCCVSWLLALSSIGHLGMSLASTFLLTDALAMLFFVLFLIFFYRSFYLREEDARPFFWSSVILAALSLSTYTWMRPMGQFIALVAVFLYALSASSWRLKLKKIALFVGIFGATIFPWFVRNHQLTGSWFFCPLFGLYFNVFNAPKILARTANIPLKEAHTQLTVAAGRLTLAEHNRLVATKSPYVYCGELICLQTAWPIIKEHPGYFIYDWLAEVAKTTFDLYSCQLAAFANNTFSWDPLVEYLDEKVINCLWTQPMPFWMRLCAWIELMLSFALWIGIIGGIGVFMIAHWICPVDSSRSRLGALWFKTGLMIGAVVMQTGGFGYARLRLPIEPLMLLLGITFWWWFFTQRKK